MDKVFIEARYSKMISLPDNLLKRLKGDVALFSSVQFLDSLREIKKQIEDLGREVRMYRPKHAKYGGQLLGCSTEKFDADTLLYVGDGRFHPTVLKLNNKGLVLFYNPLNEEFGEVKDEDIKKVLGRRKGALLKFMDSKNVGVIISIKPGQMNVKGALELKEKYKDKNFYFLLSDTVDIPPLRDFNFIDVYINTACPRILDEYREFDKPILNLSEVTI